MAKKRKGSKGRDTEGDSDISCIAPADSNAMAAIAALTAQVTKLAETVTKTQQEQADQIKKLQTGTTPGATIFSAGASSSSSAAASSTDSTTGEEEPDNEKSMLAALQAWNGFVEPQAGRVLSSQEQIQAEALATAIPIFDPAKQSIQKFLPKLATWCKLMNGLNFSEAVLFDQIRMRTFVADQWREDLVAGCEGEKRLILMAKALIEDQAGSANTILGAKTRAILRIQRKRNEKVSKFCAARKMDFQELQKMRAPLNTLVAGGAILDNVLIDDFTLRLVKSQVRQNTTVTRVIAALCDICPNETKTYEQKPQGDAEERAGGALLTLPTDFEQGGSDLLCEEQQEYTGAEWRAWYNAVSSSMALLANQDNSGGNRCYYGSNCHFFLKNGKCSKQHTPQEITELKKKREQRLKNIAEGKGANGGPRRPP
ncbi:unnamed protein product [Amoebophrya sp. A120]|nr:unnamed protein product [Amoebophrya sp. A120]|eukprot:GSA120T00024116001.1